MTCSKGGCADTPEFSDVEIDKLNPFKFPEYLEIVSSIRCDLHSETKMIFHSTQDKFTATESQPEKYMSNQ